MHVDARAREKHMRRLQQAAGPATRAPRLQRLQRLRLVARVAGQLQVCVDDQ